MNRAPCVAAALLAALLLAPAGPAAAQASAQDLGKLFLTPEQRNMLDARRKARVPDKPAAVAVESPFTRVDGSVRRSGGKSTVWVNGEAIPESPQAEAPRVATPGKRGEEVSVPAGEAKQRVGLRPGETLDRSTGQVHDVIGGGKIQVKRGDAKAQ